MKFIGCHGSRSGKLGSPVWIFLSSQAMLLAIVRMVCNPSVSRAASPSDLPYTIFQYYEETTGMFIIWNGIFRVWKAAVAPPLRHTHTAAAGLFCTLLPAE